MSKARTIRLNSMQRRYLAGADYLSKLQDRVDWDVTGAHGWASFEITTGLAEQFRAAFTDRLAVAGFDEAYELNEEGRLLEDLVDAFQA